MKKLLLSQRSRILSVLALVLILTGLSGCGGQGSVGGNGGTTPALSGTQITIDNAGVIPVFGNSPTSTVVYVHNNGKTAVSGINYSEVVANSSAKSNFSSKFLSIISSSKSISDVVVGGSQCSTIEAGQSCPLSITTPTLSVGNTQGSLEIKASYTQNNKVISFTQLISYAQVQNNLQASGAKFQAGVSISGNGNSVGYGTIYLYGSGQNQIYDVSSIIINKSAIKVVNGNISGQQIQSNFVQAVEISSPISDSSVSATITVNSNTSAQGNHSATKSSHTILKAGNSLLAGDQFSNSVDIIVESANAGAILTTGFVPLINTANGTNGSLLIHNSGDQTAVIGAVSAGSGISNLLGCSNSSLPANASCTITFSVTESGGSANITVPYAGGSAGSVAANVTWFNGRLALVSISSSVNPLTFIVTVNGSTTITVTNIGGYSLTNLNIPDPIVIGGSATATLGTNNCSTINSLPIGDSCDYVVNMTDNQVDVEQQVNVGFSASYAAVDGTKSYSRVLPITYSSVVPLIYFASNNLNGYNGNLLAEAQSRATLPNQPAFEGTNGIEAADYLCNTDESKPVVPTNVTYHAMIVANGLRQACAVDNYDCTTAEGNIDWVMRPLINYINTKGDVIGTTNGAGVFTFNTNNFIGILPESGMTDAFAWTGFNDGNWRTSSTDTCHAWASSLDFGMTGLVGVDLGAFQIAVEPLMLCDARKSVNNDNSVNGLYCVQQ